MVDTLESRFTLDELRVILAGMNTQASPGPFGLDLVVIKELCNNDILGELVCQLLNRWVFDRGVTPDLFLAILSAIPKPKKPPDRPSNLRPICITSIWYRIVLKLFVLCLTPSLRESYSANQHGFCPSRNVMTALTNIKLTVEYASLSKSPLYLM